MLEKEMSLIGNLEIRNNVGRLIEENIEWYSEYPVSISGRYHKHEPTMKIHIERCVFFAKQFITAFNLTDEEKDVLVAAVILHDIGLSRLTKKGLIEHPDWKFYQATGWSRKNGPSASHYDVHPIMGSIIVAEKPFKNSRRIQDLIECHMSHWLNGNCRESEDRLEDLCVLCDYLASREELIINEKDTCKQ